MSHLRHLSYENFPGSTSPGSATPIVDFTSLSDNFLFNCLWILLDYKPCEDVNYASLVHSSSVTSTKAGQVVTQNTVDKIYKIEIIKARNRYVMSKANQERCQGYVVSQKQDYRRSQVNEEFKRHCQK